MLFRRSLAELLGRRFYLHGMGDGSTLILLILIKIIIYLNVLLKYFTPTIHKILTV